MRNNVILYSDIMFEKGKQKLSNFLKKVLAFLFRFCYIKQVASEAARYKHLWFVGQAAKTSPSHGENRGSIPLRTAKS